ncbi:IQ calmodulin-binding motif [Popillia japonica]|uniref:IQ calmodulin-binding motif n=1 Tax=Popillia japonica TaxID=7064 RepID=A0AAW1IUT9_POPJA
MQGISSKRLVNVDLERTVSCQNLTKSKMIGDESRMSSSSNISAKKVLGRTNSGDLRRSLTTTTKIHDKIVNKQDCPKLKKDVEVPEIKKKLARNLTYNKGSPTLNGNLKAKPSELVTDDEKEIVRQFLEGFQKEETTKKKPNYSNVSTIRKNTLKRSDTYSKNQRVKEFQAIERIEQNLKTAKEFFIKTNFTSCEMLTNNSYLKASCVLNLEDNFGLGNSAAEADVRNAAEILKVAPDEVDFSPDKNKDYLSDDNSDDSGNISNELELEYEEVSPITRSRSSKIFFRSGVLTQLESQRDEKLAGMVVSLQAHCRGYLARKRLSQRKLQDLAVRCIQRNVRKFLLDRGGVEIKNGGIGTSESQAGEAGIGTRQFEAPQRQIGG